MDQILAELWKAGHEVTNNELALLLDWILRTGDVPAARRKARSAHFIKSKITRNQLNLVVACSLETTPPKCAQAFLRQKSRESLNSFSHLSSVTIHEEEERTDVTTLFPPSFATLANTRSRQQLCSWICSKHFDKLVRQIVFGIREAHGDINTITDTLLRNGVGMVAASHIAPIIASNGGLPHQLKIPARICSMVGLHDQTWFQIEPRRKLFITT